MKLYHSTLEKNIPSILKEGLKPNHLGIVYLSPSLQTAYNKEGHSILEVETQGLKLTAFEDCKDWEVLCWGHIKPDNIRVLAP